jgi:D-alanyl-D-alanine dipeptidase
LGGEPEVHFAGKRYGLMLTVTAMNSFARTALALLLPLLPMAPPARAQAPVPAGFVDAATVVDDLVVDMRYFGDHNFVGEKIDGYERPRCLLSTQTANALAAVQRDLGVRGLGLKVSIATGRNARSPISCAGRRRSTT